MKKADNLKDGKRIPVMHGENWITPVDDKDLPNVKAVMTKSYVAGHSETGHHHILEASKEFAVYEPENGDRAVLLNEVTKLFHQKSFDVHEAKFLAPGAYKIYEKTEYNPLLQIRQAVFD